MLILQGDLENPDIVLKGGDGALYFEPGYEDSVVY